MILGIGVDIVKNERFFEWKNYSQEKLSSIFSQDEINLLQKVSSANFKQFLASRFAAKEAFFKALSNTLIKLKSTNETFSFQFARKHVEIIQSTWDTPQLKINWGEFENKINIKLPPIKADLSISHEKEYSVAFVILSKEK